MYRAPVSSARPCNVHGTSIARPPDVQGLAGETGLEPLASPSGVSQQELTTVEDAELCWLDLPEPELLAAVPRAPPPCDDIERGTAD
jgi:hypothetical protein